MKDFYFDDKILGCERLSKEERRLRERLSREVTAKQLMAEMESLKGLRVGVGMTFRTKAV